MPTGGQWNRTQNLWDWSGTPSPALLLIGVNPLSPLNEPEKKKSERNVTGQLYFRKSKYIIGAFQYFRRECLLTSVYVYLGGYILTVNNEFDFFVVVS